MPPATAPIEEADPEAAHAGIVPVAAITFDVRAEKSAPRRTRRRRPGWHPQPCVFSIVPGVPAELLAGACRNRSERIASLSPEAWLP